MEQFAIASLTGRDLKETVFSEVKKVELFMYSVERITQDLLMSKEQV